MPRPGTKTAPPQPPKAAAPPERARAGEAAQILAGLAAPGAALMRRAALASGGAALIWPLQAALVAWALAAAITQALPGAPGVIAGPAYGPTAWLAGLGFFALGALRAGLGLLADRASARAAEACLAALRREIATTEAARAQDSTRGGAGAVAALASGRAELLAAHITRHAPARARLMLVSPALLVLAFALSWVGGAILLLAGPLIPLFMALIGMAAQETSRRHLDAVLGLGDVLVERLAALGDIRLLGAGTTLAEDFAQRARDLAGRAMAVLRVAFLSSTVLELFAAIGVAMMAVYVGFSLLGQIGFGAWALGSLSPESPGRLAPAAGIFLLLIAPEFFQPLRDLAAAWHDRAAALALAAEIGAWRADQAQAAARPGPGGRAPALPGPAHIHLRGCQTPSGKPLPEIRLRPGESLALIGPSGAGKTTLLRLLAGLDPAGPGQITVAGQPLGPDTADGWRARLGVMPQAPHFRAASLRANLTGGRAIGDAALAQALQAAQAQPLIAGLPRGLLTRLGETGAGLSGGEARRLTLARALIGQPDVILADEPTADLDPETARAVTEGLLAAAARGATLIVATHDLTLAARLDRRLDLGAGATCPVPA